MLDRYRKAGGFVQLVKLLETCGPSKQEKFLEIIRSEDPRWANALQHRILSFDRVFSWNQETVAEIVGTLQDLTVAIVLHGASPELSDRIRATFSHARRRKVDDLFSTNHPSPIEIAAMQLKVVETVRQMAIDGYVRFDKIDPGLVVEDAIEEKIAAGTLHDAKDDSNAEADHGDSSHEGGNVLDFSLAAGIGAVERAAASGGVDPGLAVELSSLRKKVVELGKENAGLRHEVTALKSKIDQIRKIV